MRAAFPAARAIALAASLSLGGCKIEKSVVAATPSSPDAVFVNDASFDADAMAAEDWDAKVLSALRAKARPYDEIAGVIAANPDAAGERYGFREQQTSPWTYAVKVDGVVTEAHTDSRAATIDVKTDGGHTVTLQIGPIIRGTAIRDSVSSRPFGSFKNQVDYAQYGKALNTKANTAALSKLPRDTLVGSRVSVLGVFQGGAGEPPLITPVEIVPAPKT